MARTEEEVSTATQRGGADDADRLATDFGKPEPEPARKRRAPFFVQFYRSDIGKKWVMAVSGIVLMGYVFAHMVGNLHVFEGARQIDRYGEWLRDLLDPPFPRTMALWLLRVTIIVALALHIHAAYALTRVNWRARPQRYKSQRDYVAANFASRTMRWTGIIVGLFLVFHILDLTWGTANPGYVRGEVYRNTVATFQRVPVALVKSGDNYSLVDVDGVQLGSTTDPASVPLPVIDGPSPSAHRNKEPVYRARRWRLEFGAAALIR